MILKVQNDLITVECGCVGGASMTGISKKGDTPEKERQAVYIGSRDSSEALRNSE